MGEREGEGERKRGRRRSEARAGGAQAFSGGETGEGEAASRASGSSRVLVDPAPARCGNGTEPQTSCPLSCKERLFPRELSSLTTRFSSLSSPPLRNEQVSVVKEMIIGSVLGLGAGIAWKVSTHASPLHPLFLLHSSSLSFSQTPHLLPPFWGHRRTLPPNAPSRPAVLPLPLTGPALERAQKD